MKVRKLRADEIDCRVSTINNKGLALLLYKDARCDMNILDETVGAENWQRSHELINGNLFCNVGINFPKKDGSDYWVWKQDVGTESYTEKEKGQASDAFKRACFNWGIGRELYTAPFIWIPANQTDIAEKNGKLICKDYFHVEKIDYTENKITELVVAKKNGEVVFRMDTTPNNPQPKKDFGELMKSELLRLKIDPTTYCKENKLSARTSQKELEKHYNELKERKE